MNDDISPPLDEFPIELGEALKLLSKLPINDELIELVIEEAAINELMYRFSNQLLTPMLNYQMKHLIQVWCDIIFEISGIRLNLEGFELK